MKIRMVLQKRFLPIVLKVWEPRSFHGNGLFSRAESAAYANFKVPIVEEPLKQKEQARKGFRPISASEGLLVRKANNLINKRTEHWSCRIFVHQVK